MADHSKCGLFGGRYPIYLKTISISFRIAVLYTHINAYYINVAIIL